MIFTTNLAISKDIDLTKLANLMRIYVPLKSHWQGKLREAIEWLEYPLKFGEEREDIVELYVGMDWK